MVSTTNRASVSAGTSSARPATRASTSRRTHRECFSCNELAAGGPRSRGLGRLARQRLPVLLRRHAGLDERGTPLWHSAGDHAKRFAGASDNVAVRGGIAQCGLDFVEGDGWIGRKQVKVERDI
jgi:hypothetical protein